MGNKKKLLVSFTAAFLIFGFSAIQAPKAAAEDWNFLDVKIDTDDNILDGLELWEFHGANLPHSNIRGWGEATYSIKTSDLPPAGYHCGMGIIQERTGVSDWVSILYVKKGRKITRIGKLNDANNLGSSGSDWDWCDCIHEPVNTNFSNCSLYGNSSCEDDADPARTWTRAVVNYDYGDMEWSSSEDLSLTVDGVNNTYRPLYEILCVDTHLWKTCEANECAIVGTDKWACSGATNVWTNCTVLGQTCVGGACVPVCTNACVIGQYQCIAGPQLQKCVDNGLDCGIWQNDVTSPNEVGKCTDSIDNDCDGLTDKDDPDCAAVCSIVFTNTRYGTYVIRDPGANKMGIGLGVEVGKTSNAVIKNPAGAEKYNWLTFEGSCASGPPPPVKYPAYPLVVGDPTGIWRAELFKDACLSACFAQATILVVECDSNDDCPSGKCNASGTCVAAVPPVCDNDLICDPGETPANCPGDCPAAAACTGKSFCEAALTPADAGCLCGTHVVSAAEAAAGGWCCSAVDWVAANQPTCQAVDPLCAVPPVCGNGICDVGETILSCPADCGCNNNGIQDNGETGVDCGGGGCPACPTVCGNNKIEIGEVCDSSASPSGCVAPQICNDDCTACILPPLFHGSLVPCGRNYDDPLTNLDESAPCSLCHVLVLVKRGIDLGLTAVILPLIGLLIIVSGGFLIFAGGSPKNIATGKTILLTTAKGTALALGGWLLIETIIAGFVPTSAPWRNWEDMVCNIAPCDKTPNGNCNTSPVLTPSGKITAGTGEDAQSCPSDCACNIAEGPGCGGPGPGKKECNFDGNCQANERIDGAGGSPESCPDCNTCGDNVRDINEECDGTTFGSILDARIALVGGQNCDLLVGYASGQFNCNSCKLKTDGCEQK